MKPLQIYPKPFALNPVPNFCLLPFAFCLVLLASCSKPDSGPYPSPKPLTRWWWFASEIRKEDIGSQLDWLRQMDSAEWKLPGCIRSTVCKRTLVNYTPRQAWLSEPWAGNVRYCKEYADSLGLSVDFTFGSLWPFGDLQVRPEESTQSFNDPDFRQWIRGSWDYPKQGLVLDHLNKQAFERYAGRMGRALEPAMRAGRPSGIFVDSWEVETRNLWTIGFDSIFRSQERIFHRTLHGERHSQSEFQGTAI
jgi:hypothetical protein